VSCDGVVHQWVIRIDNKGYVLVMDDITEEWGSLQSLLCWMCSPVESDGIGRDTDYRLPIGPIKVGRPRGANLGSMGNNRRHTVIMR
jgi:hypothetical protein